MSEKTIAEKLTEVAEGVSAVYNKGHADGAQSEYDRFWDEFQQNGTRGSYEYAFAGPCWTPNILKPKYPIKIVDTTDNSRFAMGMFYRFNRDKHLGELFDVSGLCEMIDLTECRNITQMFNNANVSNIILNLPKVKDMSSAFQIGDGGVIDKITLTVTDACTNYSNTFRTSALGSLTFTEGSVIGANISFQYATQLTHKSLMSIINALKSGVSGLTCTLGTTNLAKLTDAEKAKATEKGWTLA